MGPKIDPEKGLKSKPKFDAILSDFKQGAPEPCKGAGGRWVGPGGGDLGEFTFGKRWGFQGFYPQVASLTAPREPQGLRGRISSGLRPKPATEPENELRRLENS